VFSLAVCWYAIYVCVCLRVRILQLNDEVQSIKSEIETIKETISELDTRDPSKDADRGLLQRIVNRLEKNLIQPSGFYEQVTDYRASEEYAHLKKTLPSSLSLSRWREEASMVQRKFKFATLTARLKNAEHYKNMLFKLEESSQTLNELEEWIQMQPIWLTRAETAQAEASEALRNREFLGAREKRKAADENWKLAGLSAKHIAKRRVNECFAEVMLRSSDALVTRAEEKRILERKGESVLGAAVRFGSSLMGRVANYWTRGNADDGGVAASGPPYSSSAARKAAMQAAVRRKAAIVAEHRDATENQWQNRNAVEMFGDCAIHLSLSGVFEESNALRLTRVMSLLLGAKLDECVRECEFLLATLPSDSWTAQLRITDLHTGEVKDRRCFDIALKALLAQALSLMYASSQQPQSDLPLLKRAASVYSHLSDICLNQDLRAVVDAFPVMNEVSVFVSKRVKCVYVCAYVCTYVCACACANARARARARTRASTREWKRWLILILISRASCF